MSPMKERNGVRLGQPVRDADGKDLGRVTKLWEWGFEVTRGFPVLFRRDRVVRYDEVRGARDGALVVARSDRDLFDLAAGGVPRSWRVPAPPGYPSAATPAEAQLVLEDIASGAAFSRSDEPLVLTPPEAPLLTPEEEREYALTRGQALAKRADGPAAPGPAAPAEGPPAMSSASPLPALPRSAR